MKFKTYIGVAATVMLSNAALAAGTSELKLVKALNNTNEVVSAGGNMMYTASMATGIAVLLISTVLWFVSNKTENGQGRFSTKAWLYGLLASAVLITPLAYTSLVGNTLNAEQKTIDYRNLSSVSSNQ